MYDGLSSNVSVQAVPVKASINVKSGSFSLEYLPNKGLLDISYTNHDGSEEVIRTSYPEQFVALCELICAIKDEGTVFTSPLVCNIGYNEEWKEHCLKEETTDDS